LLVLNLDAPSIAKELSKIFEPLRCEKLRELRGHVVIADLVDVQGEKLAPFDETFTSDRRIKRREGSFKRWLKRLDVRIDFRARNNRNPFQPLVELLILIPAGKKKEKSMATSGCLEVRVTAMGMEPSGFSYRGP
jgi:hypothetical protein